ncbi:MAG TPA: hypothetical protein VIY49_17265, partial [Bryobacteraceae bacterium]
LHADPVSFVYGLTPLPKPTAPLTRLHYLAYFHRRGCTAPVIDVSFFPGPPSSVKSSVPSALAAPSAS